jgi:hypothetical protein
MEERLAGSPVDVHSPDFLCWLHREFYTRLPEPLHWAVAKSGKRCQIQPGGLRDFMVDLGKQTCSAGFCRLAPVLKSFPLLLRRQNYGGNRPLGGHRGCTPSARVQEITGKAATVSVEIIKLGLEQGHFETLCPQGPLRVAFPAKIHEFFFPQLFLDLPVEPPCREGCMNHHASIPKEISAKVICRNFLGVEEEWLIGFPKVARGIQPPQRGKQPVRSRHQSSAGFNPRRPVSQNGIARPCGHRQRQFFIPSRP